VDLVSIFIERTYNDFTKVDTMFTLKGLDVAMVRCIKTVYVICENHCILPNMDTEFTCYFLCNQVVLVFDWMAQKDVPIWF